MRIIDIKNNAVKILDDIIIYNLFPNLLTVLLKSSKQFLKSFLVKSDLLRDSSEIPIDGFSERDKKSEETAD